MTHRDPPYPGGPERSPDGLPSDASRPSRSDDQPTTQSPILPPTAPFAGPPASFGDTAGPSFGPAAGPRFGTVAGPAFAAPDPGFGNPPNSRGPTGSDAGNPTSPGFGGPTGPGAGNPPGPGFGGPTGPGAGNPTAAGFGGPTTGSGFGAPSGPGAGGPAFGPGAGGPAGGGFRPSGAGFASPQAGGTAEAGFAPPGWGGPDPFSPSGGWPPGGEGAPHDDRYQPAGGAPPVVSPPVTVGPPPRRGPRLWPKVLAGIVAVVVLAGLLAGSYALVRRSSADKPSTSPSTRAQSPTSSPTPEKSPIDVSARATDPAPLTVKEVFGDDDLHPDPGRDAVYHVLARDKPLTDCAKAARGQVGGVLAQYKCDQVIRATVAAPTKGYVATIGIANLADSAGAQAATDKIKELGKAGDGALTALSAPGASKLGKSPTAFTLQPYGHYLLYVVVGRTDGKAPSADATTQQIVTDLVQSYLTGVIDARRTAD